MEWDQQIYIDAGLRSAPKILNALADALEWILRQHRLEYICHYLDDFLIAGKCGTSDCLNGIHTVFRLCEILGVPLAEEKSADPATILAILGIELDTDDLMLHLPKEKLDRIIALFADWSNMRSCTKKELQSLIGQLQHATTIIKPGRTFLRRMYDMLFLAKQPHHHIRLNANFKSDLAWWSLFLHSWNGSAMTPSAVVTSDASGGWGCEAYWHSLWFQLAWPDAKSTELSIMAKELVPIVIAAAVWGHEWRPCCADAIIVLLSDTHCKGARGDRCLHFYEGYYECKLISEHLPGSLNGGAHGLKYFQYPLDIS